MWLLIPANTFLAAAIATACFGPVTQYSAGQAFVIFLGSFVIGPIVVLVCLALRSLLS